jgi:hypothetical protein
VPGGALSQRPAGAALQDAGEHIMGLKRCLACADLFEESPRVPQQNYCSRQECQRERRRLWQKQKRQNDADYKANQRQSQRRWREAHPEYSKEYRTVHPEYVERNRAQQVRRNATQRDAAVAKMDANESVNTLASGLYRLSRASAHEIAGMDSWIVRITVLDAP